MRQEDESHDGILTLPFVPSDTDGCDVQANTPDFAEEESFVSSLKRANKIITEAKYGILYFVKHCHSLMLTDCWVSGAENLIEIQANAPTFAEIEMERELLATAQKRAHEIITEATNGILHIESFVVHWIYLLSFQLPKQYATTQ